MLTGVCTAAKRAVVWIIGSIRGILSNVGGPFDTGQGQALTPRLELLAVSPLPEDERMLQAAAARAGWYLSIAGSLEAAEELFRTADPPVVICGKDSHGPDWHGTFSRLLYGRPRMVLLTAPHVDDALWEEALCRGVYSVISQPLESAELIRTVESAWGTFQRPEFSRERTAIR